MTIHAETVRGTTSSGAFSGNTVDITGLVQNILVKPTIASTIYDFKITNNRSIVVYERISEQGTLSEQVILPVDGIYTVTISNATRDEAFIIQHVVQE